MMQFKDIIAAFQNLRIVVVGDVMIDSYLVGSVSRISPEAPVPIINLSKQEDRLGGAANVALNLRALGVQTQIISVVGDDVAASRMEDLFHEKQINCEHLVKSASRKTTIKTRVIGNQQHLLRVDNEQTNPITSEEEKILVQRLHHIIDLGVDAVILEDYNKGVLTELGIQQIVDYANKKGVITAVDPKKDNFLSYQNVTLFKPNLKEIKEGLNCTISMENLDDLKLAVLHLEDVLKNQISFVTLSEHGVFIKDKQNEYHVKAHMRNIADVSGAGDTVIAVATACLAAKLSIDKVAEIANLAGGIVCEKTGVVAIDKERLLIEVERMYDGR